MTPSLTNARGDHSLCLLAGYSFSFLFGTFILQFIGLSARSRASLFETSAHATPSAMPNRPIRWPTQI